MLHAYYTRPIYSLDLFFLKILSGQWGGVGCSMLSASAIPWAVPPDLQVELEAVNDQARAEAQACRPRAPQARATRQTTTKVDGHFVKGPIPLAWMLAAAEMGAGTAKAGVLIWYAAGLWGSYYGISLQPRLWAPHFKCRQTLYRSLDLLERAGLIAVTRARGRSPEVSILVGGAPGPTQPDAVI